MSSVDNIELEGVVVEKIRGTNFKVKLNDNDMIVSCALSGKLRMNKITIVVGDKVTVEISPYDLTKGRITWRTK